MVCRVAGPGLTQCIARSRRSIGTAAENPSTRRLLLEENFPLFSLTRCVADPLSRLTSRWKRWRTIGGRAVKNPLVDLRYIKLALPGGFGRTWTTTQETVGWTGRRASPRSFLCGVAETVEGETGCSSSSVKGYDYEESTIFQRLVVNIERIRGWKSRS